MIGPVYVITDPDAPLSVLEQGRAAAHGGAWGVQLRDKHAPVHTLVSLARALVAELRPLGVKVLVNDRAEVALAADADGVHIGQGDGDPATVRAQLGAGRLLGLSIEHVSQCARIPAGVDYLGVGPIWPTPSKPDHAPPIGVEGLAEVVARTSVPAVAIGGIGVANTADIRRAGAAGIAVVSAVVRAPDPVAATRALVEAWRAAE